MLKPIHPVPCWRALAACQRLMQALAIWLCDTACLPLNIDAANCQTRMPSLIEGDWLWGLLQCTHDRRPLLDRARAIAELSEADKRALLAWVQSVGKVVSHFATPNPGLLPTAKPIGGDGWEAFKTLMLAFYDKGLHGIGLPYLPDGTPTNAPTQWLGYHQFREAFRQLHRLNPDPNARDVCVLCGGPLTEAAVDHWVRKAAFPLLAVCADNLLPICGECNSLSNKGTKDVHSGGSFVNWFHPYLRPGNASLQISYALPSMAVTCAASTATDQAKVDNLDGLLNLTKRWTIQFKAEYSKQQAVLLKRETRRVQTGQARHTQAEVEAHVQQLHDDLLPSEPHYEIHRVLVHAMSEKVRLAAWHAELGMV